jgi:hypothetical protein
MRRAAVVLFSEVRDGVARPAVRWSIGWLEALVAVSAAVLVPWGVYLALTLPGSVSAQHWPAAWSGLDLSEAAALATTAWFAVRRDRRVAFPAVAAATLLLTDAWFDVCTASAGDPLMMALVGLFPEVTVAVGCLALAAAVWRTAPAGAR